MRSLGEGDSHALKRIAGHIEVLSVERDKYHDGLEDSNRGGHLRRMFGSD